MWGWIKTWDLRTVVAVVALAQTWVYWAWRKWGRAGHLDVHRTGTVEVGFSGWGATVGVHGTLRSVDRDFFVSSMTLTVIRESDHSQHKLEWGAFRPPA